jgi:LuxR family maltose regulon positive regulatory protein
MIDQVESPALDLSGLPPAQLPLLLDKLRIPQPQPALVGRARLLQQLDHAYQRPVTLLAAPAGFGKTTLISNWAQAQSIPIAWVALEAAENDPLRFWTYLLTALERTYVGSAATALAALQTAAPAALDTALTVLLNTLASSPGPLVLVLDDCHVLTAPAIAQSLTFFIDHLPSAMHLILASRSDPPLALARLRAHNALLEIRTDQLRFSAAEAAELLNHIMALELDDTDVAALLERTEGWGAGLHLAALALQGELDRSAFISTFHGSERFILDYLLEEVLAQQPAEIQQFLLQTAILDRLSAPLCDALTQRTDSQAILERLEHANLFLIPLDHVRRSFRYHQLFADSLRVRLQYDAPESVAALHQRAADWYLAHGNLAEAVPHALAADNVAQGAGLLDQLADNLAEQSDMPTVQRWLDALPEAALRTHARLCLAQAWRQIALLRLDQVEAWVDAAITAGRTTLATSACAAQLDQAAIHAEAALIRTLVVVMQGAAAPALAELAQAFAQIPLPRRMALEQTAALTLSFAYLARGDATAARQALNQALVLNDASPDRRAVRFAELLLTNLDTIQGQVRAAATAEADILVRWPGAPALPPPLAAALFVGLGKLHYAQNDLQAAEQFARAGLRLSAQLQDARVAFDSWGLLARIAQARGRGAEAVTHLDRAAQVARDGAQAGLLAVVAIERARLALAQGDAAAAHRWAARERAGGSDGAAASPIVDRGERELVLARVLIAERELAAAQQLLVQVHDRAEVGGWYQIVIEALVLQASAWQRQGEPSRARAQLLRALALAEPERYVRVFLDDAAQLQPLLAMLAEDLHAGRIARTAGVSLDYVAALLATQEQPLVLPAMALPAPATQRSAAQAPGAGSAAMSRQSRPTCPPHPQRPHRTSSR